MARYPRVVRRVMLSVAWFGSGELGNGLTTVHCWAGSHQHRGRERRPVAADQFPASAMHSR
jgi:hypothetical protein